jgi:eukaryotic-like serine/threonine-protein kinase
MSADRNLLFGILAVQSGFCTATQLVEAMNAWTLAKQRPLGDILLEHGFLLQDEHDLIAALVAKQLAKHGGDVDKSLAALSPTPRFAAQLARIADADVQQSLAAWSSANADDTDRTRAYEASASGDSIRYRILRPHARGGLGEVYVARDEELGREVALKEIQPQHADNLDSRGRFVREAEVTGGLEHPGVVAVYGLGSYADGRPFYAMRFIQGDSLKEAIERFHKTGKQDFGGSEFRQLLGRFIDVCQAIAYAHSRGVLHRDLKPGNIMLGKFGETLVVDWGLAKVVGTKDVESGDRTLNISSGSGQTPTMQGQAIGTPAFMSPEQAAGKLDELGPATDVYSLGATLYSLLANRAPIQADGIGEVLSKAERGEWAPLRSVNPAIPVPLAAICAKAMALKPSDRYPSGEAFADDVERFLADEPVTAHRDPLLVRAGRWARKHRTAVTTAAATLLVGTAAMGIGLAVVGDRNSKLDKSLQREKDRAEGERLAKFESETAKEQALKRLAQVEKSNQVLGAVFDDLNIRDVKHGTEPLEAVLAKRLMKAGEQLEGDAVGDPMIVANLQNRLGVSLLSLGRSKQAIGLLAKALEARKKLLGDQDPETLMTMGSLGMAYQAEGEHNRALPYLEEAHRLAASKLDPDHEYVLTSISNLADFYRTTGRFDRAVPLLERSLRLAKTKKREIDILRCLNNLGEARRATGKLDEALQLWEEAYAIVKAKLDPGHYLALTVKNNLGVGHNSAGKPERAIPLLEETFRISKERLGRDHPETLGCMGNLAEVYRAAGKLEQALPLLEETMTLKRAILPPGHPSMFQTLNSLAFAYQESGKIDRAMPLFEELVTVAKAKLGTGHPVTLTILSNTGGAYQDSGKLEAALTLFEQASSGVERLKFEHEFAGRIVPRTIAAYETANQLEKAETWRRKWTAVVKRKTGADSPAYAMELAALGLNLLKQNKWVEAEVAVRDCLTLRESKDPNGWPTFNSKAMLGASLLGQKKHAEAEPLLLKGYLGMKQREKLISPAGKSRLPEAVDRLIELYTATNKPDEVKKWQAERAKYPTSKPSEPKAKK